MWRCGKCDGLVPARRREAHETMWCPSLTNSAADLGDFSDPESGDSDISDVDDVCDASGETLHRIGEEIREVLQGGKERRGDLVGNDGDDDDGDDGDGECVD